MHMFTLFCSTIQIVSGYFKNYFFAFYSSLNGHNRFLYNQYIKVLIIVMTIFVVNMVAVIFVKFRGTECAVVFY
jgi:ABC-type uncharacterized transport system fused permease/ATPase subunit